ncbi:peroxidase-like, partial [Agrilus planipennis]|uniref:Peroxidase-like n=1 Tax=Agrilus planipennis TaxID=224129 RepID=A0A1W4XPE3_AGRPL
STFSPDYNVNAILPLREDPRSTSVKISDKDLNRSVEFAQDVLEHLQRLENSLQWSNINVRHESPVHGQLIESSPEREALLVGRDALISTKATAQLVNTHCGKHHLNPSECVRHMSNFKLTTTSLRESCPEFRKRCTLSETHSPYRSTDGSCNHANKGVLGQSLMPYKRLLSPDYLDGVQEPRRSVNRKYPLPSARSISTSLNQNSNFLDNEITLAVMQWSQFVEHDLAHTPTHKMIHSQQAIECCDSHGRNLSPRYKHPFCHPIHVSMEDEFYSKHGIECMTYVRSLPSMRADCSLGPMDQMNQATHYLDGSQLYGSNPKKAFALRKMEGGLLDYSEYGTYTFLPIASHPSESCQGNSNNSLCFKSGDSRVNTQPQLTAMYTIWLREHNRIATLLHRINPHWSDEILYQEARRIVIAEMQHITYSEWIPVVLGNRLSTVVDDKNNFNERIDPTISNSFATAALRFINSLMEGNLKLYKENRSSNTSISLSNFFNKPTSLEKPGFLDALIRGLATQASQKLDLNVVDEVTTLLYRSGSYGYDVLSLDIQRGRDHGLPSYTSYRTLCGLPEVSSFDDLDDVIPQKTINILKEVYGDPRDIDLLIGGLSERPVRDSLLGPTFSCIITDQMWRTKHGDRYFYTNANQPKPFTVAQLAQLKKVTLARIFCDNGADIRLMQPNAFRKINQSNQLVECSHSEIPRVDFSFWAENYTLPA